MATLSQAYQQISAFAPPRSESAELGDEIGAGLQFVTVDVHGHSYALPIGAVIEFRMWIEPTPLPHSPSHLLGIINIRGEIVPVFDVGARLGYGRSVPSPQHVITLVQTVGEQVVGLLVDDVSDIRTVPAVTPLTGGEGTCGNAAVDGVIKIGDAVLGVISVDALCGEVLAGSASSASDIMDEGDGRR